MNTFEDFKNAIGKKFKVVDTDGKPFHGLMGEQDFIKRVHDEDENVEGDKFIAHYSVCRFIQEQPAHLKHKK